MAVGVVSSLGLVAVSALLNFRMGYRSADTELDGWIYGLGAGLADTLKALTPFMIAYGMKHRDWLAAGAAAMLFAVFTAYSFTAAIGFAAEHRSAKAAQLTAAIETRQDLRGELRRQQEELNQLGTGRPSAEIEADIAGLLGKPVGPRARPVADVSAGCTLSRAASRDACAAVATLASELARARKRDRAEDSVRQLRSALENGGGEGARATPDAQVDAIRRFGRLVRQSLSERQVGFVLSVLLALLVEVGSGLGLFVATTPWRHGGAPAGTVRHVPQPAPVDSFMLDGLQPSPGAELGVTDLYLAYRHWSVARGQLTLPRVVFARQFGALAGSAGIQARTRNRTTIYLGIALVRPVGR